MEKRELITRSKGDYTKEKMTRWIEALAGTSVAHSKPTKCKVGDVFMHSYFKHPYVLLEYNETHGWLCALLTTEETCPEILVKCNSRFFENNYITTNLFTVKDPLKNPFGNVYDNNRQLKKVLSELKSIFK